jgi:hypothetical protein
MHNSRTERWIWLADLGTSAVAKINESKGAWLAEKSNGQKTVRVLTLYSGVLGGGRASGL